MDNSKQPDSSSRQIATSHFLKNFNYVQYIAFTNAPSAQLQDDIVNDAYVEFVSKADQWDYRGNIRALLKKITQDIANKYWRIRIKNSPQTLQRIGQIIQDQTRQMNESAQTDNFAEELSALKFCLERLSPKSRELIESCYLDEIPVVSMVPDGDQKKINVLYKTLSRIRAVIRQCVKNALKGDSV